MKIQVKLRMSAQRSWKKASGEAKNEISVELRNKLSPKLTNLPTKLKKASERS